MLTMVYKKRTLVIVPTTNLVHQMKTDFESYSPHTPLDIAIIMQGQSKQPDAEIVISTWQSVFKLPEKWFHQFDVVIGDEVHLFAAKSLKSIMENLINCKYRFGLTGTLDGSKTNKLVLEGLFGEVTEFTDTAKLIEDGILSQMQIHNVILKYSDTNLKQAIRRASYQQEMQYLTSLEERNEFILNLAKTLTGNTLVLFQYVKKQGKPLYKMATKEKQDKYNYYLIYGDVKGADRDAIRPHIESTTNNIIIASLRHIFDSVSISRIFIILFLLIR